MGLDMYMIKRKRQSEDVAYWRKANAIHNWLVENVQYGEDNCYPHEISKEQLEELRATCRKVLESLVKGGTHKEKVKVGRDNNGDIYKEIDVYNNIELAEELLPTTSGFFFGSTTYDEWYKESLEKTIEQIDNILENTDFDTELIEYCSSW